jgi:hypothetical protein
MPKKPKPSRIIQLPIRCGDVDPEVQEFIEQQFWNIGPYSNPAFTRSAQQIFERALFEFGDTRCINLEFWQH